MAEKAIYISQLQDQLKYVSLESQNQKHMFNIFGQLDKRSTSRQGVSPLFQQPVSRSLQAPELHSDHFLIYKDLLIQHQEQSPLRP